VPSICYTIAVTFALWEKLVSNEEIALVLQKRLRQEGYIPGVIHDHGKTSKIVMAPYLEMIRVYQRAGKHHPLSLSLGKEKYMALIKEIDIEPKKHKLRHVVFNAIKQDEKAQTEVPIRLEGEIPAEKAGLMVITQLSTVEIEAYPKDLVDELVVSAESLVEIGDRITVADLKIPSGITVLTEAEHPIASVEETKAQISEEETAGEGEQAEGENEEASASNEGGDSEGSNEQS
jgi:large subunit ribosomal protein L25